MSIRHRINMGSEKRPYWIEMGDKVFKEFNRLLKEEADKLIVADENDHNISIKDLNDYFEFNPELTETNNLICCSNCNNCIHYSKWEETSILCDDCGEHFAIKCPERNEKHDCVFESNLKTKSKNNENMTYPFPIAEDKIKFKYLDREDIESLGFNTEDNGTCYNIKKGFDIYGLYPLEDNLIEICKFTNTLFKGMVKNKSELKRILKILNIN
jgi:hypothetical protein